MATVRLDNQLFCAPPVASGAPSLLPPLQDAHSLRHGRPGDSLKHAFLISDGETDCDDPNESTSNPALLALEVLPTAGRTRVQSRSVACTDEEANTTSSASGSDDKFMSAQRSDGPSPASPRALHIEHEGPVRTSGSKPSCAGSPCRQGLGCPRHPNLTKIYGRYRQAKELGAQADNPFRPPQTLLGESSNTSETEQLLDAHDLPREGECFAKRGDDTDYLASTRNGGREDTFFRDKSGKSELASPEPALQPPNNQDQIEFRRNFRIHSNVNPKEDYGPTHPPVSGEQDKVGPDAPPPGQESPASIPRLSGDEPSMQLSTGQNQVNIQHDTGRRLHWDTDDGQNDCPMVNSDVEKDGVVLQPRRKRRRVSTMSIATGRTASQQQTRQYCGDSSSREARRLSRHPKRHGERGCARPPSREFTRDPCAEHGAGHRGTGNRGAVSSTKSHHPARQGTKGSAKDKDKPASTSRRARYTPADDTKICRLKEQGLSWTEIAEQFTGRSAGAIKVRYYTKLKKEEEWEVEAICRHKTRDDGHLELLVRWRGGEETWEPYENVAETVALDEYERLHGIVTIDTIDAP